MILGLVSEIADKVIVMYKGEMVECGYNERDIFKPQTSLYKGIAGCRPDASSKGKRLPVISDFLRRYQDGRYQLMGMQSGNRYQMVSSKKRMIF